MSRTQSTGSVSARSGRRRAFSLVELLVVVGIIALLIALLLPALKRAREVARQMVCASNLHQLAMGWLLYGDDNRGHVMPLAYHDQFPVRYWWGTDAIMSVDHRQGFLWPYLKSELKNLGLFECPEQAWGTYTAQGASKSITSTYGYNGYYLSPAKTPGWSYSIGHRPWRKLESIRDPARLFAFADSGLDISAVLKNTALLDPPWLFESGEWRENANPTTSFRHVGITNVAHADGHVAGRGLAGGHFTAPLNQIGSVGLNNDPHYVPDWRDW